MSLRLLILLSLVCLPLQAREFIETFHSDIEVLANGDLIVTETIVVKAEGKSIRRGIYRDFPTRYQNKQGGNHLVGFEVLSVKRDGSSEAYRVQNRSNGRRVYIGDADYFLPPGFYQYELRYLTTRQLGLFEDFDELYWNVTGNGWSFPIDKASALVSLPAATEGLQLTGYTGRQGSTAQALTHRRVAADQAYFETTQPLAAYQGLTIVAAWDKGIIAPPSPAQQRAWFFEDNKPTLIVAAGLLLLFVWYFFNWRRVGRDPETGVIMPRYQPPPGYSPASMRFIERMGYDKKCFTVAVINLAVKGVVDISDDDGEFKLTKKERGNADLAPGENQALNALFGTGREQIKIAQTNQSTLAAALNKHEKSLKRDYEKIYFSTNSGYLFPGMLLTLITIALAGYSIPSSEDLMTTIITGVFTMMPLLMLFNIIKGMIRRGRVGKLHFISNLLALIVFVVIVFNTGFPFLEFASKAPWLLLAGIALMLLMNYFFYQWLKAPTLAGRRLLDQIEGFKHYLQVAEEDEIALQGAPEFGSDIYETYLPYAIALELENEWTAKLDRAIASGTIEKNYHQPRWFRSHHSGAHFSKSLANSFSSAISSSSVAPGSSSGSSGGSSGGGGGGGGGGGW